MMIINKKKTQDIVLYVANELGEKIEGKKKLMKLMFLIEHFDINKKELIENKFIGNSFFIYNYGVFSVDVMKCVNDLFDKGKMKESYPLKVESKKPKLEKNTKEKVDYILEKFGNNSGSKLEIQTLKMLGLSFSEKENYFGDNVDEIIRNKK